LVCIPASSGENLALKGTVTQSSTYLTHGAQYAIDGERYRDEFCSTTAKENNPWWMLDLLNVYNISRVIITAHGSSLEETSGAAEIRIGNSLIKNPTCAVIADPLPGNTVSYSCHGMEGRYVNVLRSGPPSHLSLCEVEVYETDNLASKGTVTQSSTYLTRVAQHAVDGVRDGQDIGTYCSSTSLESVPWWRLDLLDVYEINTVIISARPDCCVVQTNGAEILIGNSLENNGNNNPICAVTSGLLLGHTISYSCGVMEGRYVNLFIPGSIVLSLCEVEVYGKFLGQRTKTFLRLKFSSSGDVAAESDDILHQLQSALASHISVLKVSWTQHPKKEEEKEEEDTRKHVKYSL
ncbi:hypothetical protein IRJ41_009707, partial [Triplophysa rosa]